MIVAPDTWVTDHLTRSVHVTSPVPRDVWLRALERDPHALVTQTPGWLAAIRETEPYLDVSRWYRWPGGRELILPLVRRRWTPAARGPELGWPAGWGSGGVVAPGGKVTAAEAAVVFADLERRPQGRAHLYPDPPADGVWRAAAPASARLTPRLTYTLPLDGGLGTVWRDRLGGAARGAVRRAGRAGLTVERGNSPALLDDFDLLYRTSVDRWARQCGADPVQARRRAELTEPRRKFAAVAGNLGDGCVIWLAYHEGAPVAGTITLWHGTHAEYWRGAMDKPAAAATSAPTLLQYLAIEEACARGCRSYHMGDSRHGDPTGRFKRSFGAVPHHGAGYWIGTPS